MLLSFCSQYTEATDKVINGALSKAQTEGVCFDLMLERVPHFGSNVSVL